MSGVKGTLWEINDHTLAKHAILKRYLQAWYPIVGSTHNKIVYIDGFAGPGEYLNGEKGSPIIAIEEAIAIKNKFGLRSKIMFLFIEEKKDRAENLKRILNSMVIPDKFEYEVCCGRFNEILNSEINKVDVEGGELAPTFVFIDPFGYSDTPFYTVERIMSYKSCEVLITFMSGFMNRFKEKEPSEKHINELLGTTDWQHEIFNNQKSGEEAIVDYYQSQLKTISRYVRSFEMKNKSNQPIYRLIFATNEYKGLLKMKESMWNVDKTGQFSYSDTTNPNQTVLFEQKPEYSKLKKLLLYRFEGKEASINEIEKFVVIDTPFRETHFKREILTVMEKANPPEIEIINAKKGRKKCTYADEKMIIKFNSQTPKSSHLRDPTRPKSCSHTMDLSSFLKK